MLDMILKEHPHKSSHPRLRGGVRAIGYWRSEREPLLPDPKMFVDPSWDATEREDIARYLDAGEEIVAWRGSSQCRFCSDLYNGSVCLGDGAFVWPSGLSHYLRVHSVRLPAEFVTHARAKGIPPVNEIDKAMARLLRQRGTRER